MLREDGTGAIEYFYGKMGEVTKTRRTLIVPNQAIATYVTQWTYDSHNRLLEMIYPDEEKVSYTYDLGGQLTNVHGYKSYGYDYVNRIGYDKFGQRTYMKYCNGAETFYTYEPQRRRLQGLKVDAGGRTIMDNAYTYDAVSNVLGVTNGAALPQSGKAGGQMSHSYAYDALYRLSSATGTYTGADGKTASYTLSMGYDNMHRITSKSQHLTQENLQFDGTLNVGYDLAYTYGQEEGKKFQLANVSDVNYRTEATPDENQNTRNSHAYDYDANGNLVYVNTGRTKKDGTTDEKAHERKLKWDEENRLLASDDDGFVTNYWYDADGERTVKTSGESEQVYVNSGFAGGRTNTAKFSLYVSPYLVANQGGRYTKHIYIGGERIVSKIGDFASYGPDPRRIEYAGSEADAVTVDYDVKYSQQLQAIKNNYATFGVPYNGTDNDDYVDGEGFCCDDGSLEAAQAKAVAQANALDGNFQEGDAYENLQFYYHADHLGSTSYITNLDGEVVQHVEYVPFGEVFIEERNNTWNTPYLFNAKEFDEETGLYYYGARYYDPRLGLWMNVDPLGENNLHLSPYNFVSNNPLNRIDAWGLTDYEIDGEIKRIDDGHSNLRIAVSKDEFKNLQSLFNQNFSKYERNMNDISFKNGFTTYRTINDGSIGNNILNTLEVTFHRPNKMSYAEWSMSSPIIGGISLLNDYYFGFENSMTTQSYRISMVSAAMNTQISGNNRAFNFIETLSNRYQYSKVVSTIGNYGTYAIGIYNVYQGYKLDGQEFGYHTQRAFSGSLFGGLGSYLGTNSGAYIGAYVGAYFGGIGAVPGAIIGGFIGGYFGSSYGQALGENVVDEYYK